jgi:DNA polymerase I-like protein with 3'-5' exonuclease and polymerase domains
MCGGLTRGLVDLALMGECDYEDVASRSRDLMLPLRQLHPPVGDVFRTRAEGPRLSDFAAGLTQPAVGGAGLLLHGAVEDAPAEQLMLERAHDALGATAYEVREHSFHRVVGAMRLRGLRIDVVELDRQLSQADAPPVLSRTKQSLRHGRTHPTMDALQASGRLSVSRPALTTLGRRGDRVVARRVVIPEDGHVLMSVDLSQIEPRVVAALSQDRGMLDAFDAGMDFHSHVATELFGGLEHRTLAKRFNNALLYGAGVDTLAEAGGLSHELVREYTAAFTYQFPEWVCWSSEMTVRARSGKLLDNEHGRMLKVLPRRAHTAAPATVAQSCARDVFVGGVLRMHARGLSKYLRLLIHDEVLLSVPAGEYDDIALAVQDCLTTSWTPSYASRSVAIEAAIGRPGANWAAVYEGE